MHCKYLSDVPYKALEKFSKALYGTTGGTYSAPVFRPIMVCKLIVDMIPYRMATFVLISIIRIFKPFPLTFVSNLVLQ